MSLPDEIADQFTRELIGKLGLNAALVTIDIENLLANKITNDKKLLALFWDDPKGCVVTTFADMLRTWTAIVELSR